MQISLRHGRRFVLAVAACLVASTATRVQAATDPLPSWNEGAVKARIVSFVQAVTDPTGKDYIAPGARVAVFDEMLEWTTSAPGPRLGVIVHHDDAVREFAYDRGSHIGKLERGLDEAGTRGWSLISVKDDRKTVYTPQQ